MVEEKTSSFRSLSLQISSSSLDSSPSGLRHKILCETLECLRTDVSNFEDISLFKEAVERCTSFHSHSRVLRVVITAFVQSCYETVSKHDASLCSVGRNLAWCLCEGLVNWSFRNDNVSTKSKKGSKTSVVSKVSRLLSLELDTIKSRDQRSTLNLLIDYLLDAGAKAQSSKHFAPAVSMVNSLLSIKWHSVDDNTNRRESMMELLGKRLYTCKWGASTSSIVSLCSLCLCSMDQNEFDQHIGFPMVLKLKANPESVFETCNSILSIVSSCEQISLSTHADKLVAAALRQLRSPKNNMREAAVSFLGNLAKNSSDVVSILKPISDALPGLATPVQREAAYNALGHVVEMATPFDENTDNIQIFVVTSLQKEPAANTVGKEAGVRALTSFSPLTDRAISYLTKPILDVSKSKGASAISTACIEFRFRMGITLSSIEDMADLLSSANTKDLKSGLEAIVENSVKKSSSLVPQTDGLMALYLLLLLHSMNADQLPPSIIKVFTNSSSFLFSDVMFKSVSTDQLIGKFLPSCIFRFCEIMCKDKNSTAISKIFTKQSSALLGSPATGMVLALAVCIATPHSSFLKLPIEKLLSHVLDIPAAAEAITLALFCQVNSKSNRLQAEVIQQRSTRQAREAFHPIRSEGSPDTYAHVNYADLNNPGVVSHSVREHATILLKHVRDVDCVSKALLLTHIGTSQRTDNRQRRALVEHLGDTLKRKEKDESIMSISLAIASCATNRHSCSDTISLAIHQAAVSLITSFGSLAGNFDPEYDNPEEDELKHFALAQNICTNHLSANIMDSLTAIIEKLTAITTEEVDLYYSKEGVLFTNESLLDNAKTTTVDKKPRARIKGGGAFSSSLEEEEWERQVKKEIAEKKKKQEIDSQTPSDNHEYTPEERELLSAQTKNRQQIKRVIDVDFPRTMAALSHLIQSDVEIGNACLGVFWKGVVNCSSNTTVVFQRIPHLYQTSYEALVALATCVFELDETLAPTLARALIMCHGGGPVPPPYHPVARVLDAIDDTCDCLSGNSFGFVFSILKSALTGPRTPLGCESALKILHLHTPLLTSNSAASHLRRDIASSVLGFLSHDRAKAFANPSAMEVLLACYEMSDDTNILTASEMAPLLGEIGALGLRQCRLGSMMVLKSLAEVNPNFIKNNPLTESRIWLNCFDKDKDVQGAARQAWRVANSCKDNLLPAPSKMYSIPLLPLLHHANSFVSIAAANSFAHAMGQHPDSVERSITRLCTIFIDVFPKVESEAKKKEKIPFTPKEPPKKLLKKAPKSKSLISSSGKIGKLGQNRTKSKTSALMMTPKPKKVRNLAGEFLSATGETSSNDIDAADKDNPSKVATREGLLRAISALPTVSKLTLELPVLQLLVGFLMAYGLADNNENVRTAARDSVRDIVSKFGDSPDASAFLLQYFEDVLSTGQADSKYLGSLSSDKIPRDTLSSDRRKEGGVVCLGAAAIHLKGEETFSKIDATIDMLLATLRTPSESVQSSVAICLSKLMKKGRTPERVEAILSSLMKECLGGKSLAVQRGSAYGISAVVKGSGIAILKKFGVVKQLDEACSAGTSSEKEGALFAIELLSARLGLLFEPYVIALLPALLRTFSDSNDHVRMAAASTADLIMSKLSAHGVKLVMPAVLTAFSEPAWRTKQASIHMLGSMSHCAPKQLANCLPKVVPRLTEAFSDTHPKVKNSAEKALEEICKVIKNPEISSISSTLLQALTDPSNSTLPALEALIETEFVHAIDAPSLALLVPVLHRGLRDRSAQTKRYGALISGNICTMINDSRDFLPYLDLLLPDLKAVLLDPIPDVRSTAAKALGALTRGLGEDCFPGLRPWLIDTLKGDLGTTVERSGAAQGLTEVIIAGGTTLVENVMRDQILPLKSHPSAATREGVLWVLTFIPSSLGQAFSPLIDVSLPALLSGLSDDNEQVRDVALRAGRVLIRSHGKAHIDRILPSLEAGLIDDDHQIRVSSLTLLGDLLSLIGGTKVYKGETDTQEGIRQAERAQAQIAIALGSETRKRVLSGLYLARSDTYSVVRSSAVMVWKTIVSVTPRTLRDILDVLVGKIVDALASGHSEQTQVAGRCLGDIVRKLGDTVLPEIIPVLRDELYNGGQHTRQGVCIGLTEVIESSSKEQIQKYLQILLKAVQDALCDEDIGVRKIASSCFQSLYDVVGSKASDEVVPILLAAMEKGNEASRVRALNGLTGILSVRSKELLPYLIQRLLQKPITKNHANALATISSVTGGTIHLFFRVIIPSFLNELDTIYKSSCDDDEERTHAIRNSIHAIFHNVESGGINFLVNEITSKCSSDKEGIRKECCWMIGAVVQERSEFQDYFELVPLMYRELLYRLNDDSTYVLKAANSALSIIAKHVPAEELVNHIEFCRNLIASMVSDARRRKGGVGDGEFLLPGLNMPKGLEPLLPMYQRGILYGNSSIREVAASGLGELITITSSKYLAGPFIIKLTGPLLRVVGDRNPSAVKISIVQTLGLILTKGGMALRAFVPQFQTTFVKALSDPSRQVRVEAINALALLMPLSTRLDPLIKELVLGSLGSSSNSNAETAGIAAVQAATLEALACVLKHGGKKAKREESIPSALDAAKGLIVHVDVSIREGAAKVLGVACNLLGTETTLAVIQESVLGEASSDSSDVRHGIACACLHLMYNSCLSEHDQVLGDLVTLVVSLMDDEVNLVREASCVAVGALLGCSSDVRKHFNTIEEAILNRMNPSEDIEVQRCLARGLTVATTMDGDLFVGERGLAIMNGAMKLAMSGTQRVQHSFNDFLWVALQVSEGTNGLDDFVSLASFENGKTMKTLASKVLARIKNVDIDI